MDRVSGTKVAVIPPLVREEARLANVASDVPEKVFVTVFPLSTTSISSQFTKSRGKLNDSFWAFATIFAAIEADGTFVSRATVQRVNGTPIAEAVIVIVRSPVFATASTSDSASIADANARSVPSEEPE